MSSESQHSDPIFSPRYNEMLDASRSKEELGVPEQYFSELESVMMLTASKVETTDLQIPDDYFQLSGESMATFAEEGADPADPQHRREGKDFVHIPQKAAPISAELFVPAGYFNDSSHKLLKEACAQTKVYHLRLRRLVMFVAAAAVVAALVFLVIPKKGPASGQTFAELAANTDLDIEDMAYFASEEEIYQLYSVYEGWADADTTARDTTAESKATDATLVHSVPSPAKDVPLDPRTGLPVKKSPGALKPSSNEDVLRWEDISNEELMEYLLEEGDMTNDL